MMLRIVALATALTMAPAAMAQEMPPAPASAMAPVTPAPRPATVKVNIATSEGAIVLELERERAPLTTANFLKYVATKRFDGAVFYRALNLAPGYGLVQGGLRNDPRKLFAPVAHEPTSKTGLSHKDGVISMARNTPGSATADFFIVMGDMSSLDANLAAPGDNLGFAAFGRVVEGMDVVKRILALPTSATEGGPAMKGQILVKPVKIMTARKLP